MFGSTPGGASGDLLGIDAVREFNVQANTYGAQYGKRYGGQINVVTMSGTNRFHGTMFDFLRNDLLDASSYFDNQSHANNNSPKPAYWRNDFGAAAGGPIRKDKTFIFGNYEGIRQRLTTTNVAFVPDSNARLGLLPCSSVTPAPSPCPASGLAPAGLIPGMVPYFALWPAPNGPSLGTGIATAYAPALNPVREDFGTVRADHNFSEKNWLSGAFTIDDGYNLIPAQDPLTVTLRTLRTQVASLDETHVFSPSIINTARIGFSRGSFFQDVGPSISLPASLSLIAGLPMGQISVGASGPQSGALSTFGGLGGDEYITRNLFTYSDSVQITKGKHLINLGAWFQRVQVNELFIGSAYGSAVFGSLQSLLQGKASQFSGGLSGSKKYSRQWQGAWYVDDTIKVLPNLTLSLGLRHEFTNGWNVYPQGPVNFLQGPNGVLQTQPLVATSMFTANNAKWLFGPRVGLAWDPFGRGKTSIHAGYGMYYNLLDDMTYILPKPAYVQISNVQYPFQVVPGVSYPGAVPTPYGLLPTDPKTPTVHEWRLTVEQQLTASTALSVGYVGSHGYHILGGADANPAQSVICPASPCPASIPAGTKYFPSVVTRLNPALGTWNGFNSFVNSSYNSLQIDLRQRLTKGLTIRANYAFSKALDDGSANVGGFFNNCPPSAMDGLNPGRDYGPSCYDVQQRFAFSGSYELPIGQGKAFLGGLSGAANKLLGGWKLNGIVSAQSGLPFTPVIGFANSHNGGTGGNERPSWNPNFSGPVILGTPNKWFNPQAFILLISRKESGWT